jgi:hypothetical protein
MKINNVLDPAEFICDCPQHKEKIPAFGLLSLHFWNGSEYAFKQGQLHLCDKCAEDIMYLLKKEFGVKDFLKPIEEI